MKQTLRHLLLVAAVVLLAGGCARHKIISDEELACIFRDAFLTNAYIGNQNLKTDSLRLYEPIFARYGYTTEDVYYTIGNFSKRKSARLGDVVEQAIDMLEREGKIYSREVAILDTVDHVASRTFTRTVLSDSLIRVRSLRDTARLDFTLAVEPGDYRVSFRYRVDSLDRNEQGLKGSVWLERENGSKVKNYSSTLYRNHTNSFTRHFTADQSHRTLRLKLLDFYGKPARPSLTVTDLKVEHTPVTETAVRRLYEEQLNIRIFADEFFRDAARAKDSL